MRAIVVLIGCLAVFSAGTTVAETPRAGPAPKAAPRPNPTAGTHHPASSFAPRPTRQRTFGAPIQPPIMKHVTPKKKQPAPRQAPLSHPTPQ